MNRPRSVVIVGESIAGITVARTLRGHGYDEPIRMIGADPRGAYARPPLSKDALRDPGAGAEPGLPYAYADLGLDITRSPAVRLDVAARQVITSSADIVGFDALVIATGARPRRLATPAQKGELVLRDADDACALRHRLATASTAIVVGAGFLGMEVASACVDRGVAVTVVDVDPPLQRLLGGFLSERISSRATDHGVRLVRATGPVRLAGNPVRGVVLPSGTTLPADVVVSCVGDVPATGWLAGSGLADELGVPVDERCATSETGIYAAGDVAYVRTDCDHPARAPFWSNAVAQGKVAASSVLGIAPTCEPRDDYFWTEILELPIKVVGPLPVSGEPTSIDGAIASGDALLRWEHEDGHVTVVAYGRRVSVPRLRAMARPPALQAVELTSRR